jgi:D-alanyl-D-alanine carboxypeptidase/D-alanyl-D-alanine-endopeptidase (penicillin-binding protein 4)
LASIQSLPLPAVLHEMLANSDNNTAELMVKEIGLSAGGVGTRDTGLAVMTATLASWGLDMTGVVFADGSGLSLDNRITCPIMLAVLQRTGFEGPIGQGLAVAGQTGTLVDVFTESDVAGRLRGKTGTLNNPPFNEDPPAVKALAGYLPVVGGGAVEYVMILNGPTISDQSEYRPLWDQLVELLATYPSAAGPDVLGPR